MSGAIQRDRRRLLRPSPEPRPRRCPPPSPPWAYPRRRSRLHRRGNAARRSRARRGRPLRSRRCTNPAAAAQWAQRARPGRVARALAPPGRHRARPGRGGRSRAGAGGGLVGAGLIRPGRQVLLARALVGAGHPGRAAGSAGAGPGGSRARRIRAARCGTPAPGSARIGVPAVPLRGAAGGVRRAALGGLGGLVRGGPVRARRARTARRAGHRPDGGRHAARRHVHRRGPDSQPGAGSRRRPDHHRHAGTGRHADRTRRAGRNSDRSADRGGAALGPPWLPAGKRPGRVRSPAGFRLAGFHWAGLLGWVIGLGYWAGWAGHWAAARSAARCAGCPGRSRPAGPGHPPGLRAARPAEARPAPVCRAARNRPRRGRPRRGRPRRGSPPAARRAAGGRALRAGGRACPIARPWRFRLRLDGPRVPAHAPARLRLSIGHPAAPPARGPGCGTSSPGGWPVARSASSAA